VLKLTYSNLEFQNFPGEDPRTPSLRGGDGREGGRGTIGRGGKDRGRGGMGEWGGEGGERRSTWAPPP